ncbi:unnamed protein product [Rotaria magnacalcarata]|uniref:Uncharacterized protein n=3 Tax=Rotaria magnacalcarata TaxID=392030 RepID=A0A816YJZ9_9BILA|nr:unnamed protein product [Rotaria magnacalcarata]CAF1667583.1 unnamed protein product [Rotaria magnacalcarata]CAF1935423.1 unnamed protein product [Rotaria magnacalcarata]CAF2158579.1 unnamed protein product [Rotaria magnacalcarata]CAF3790944.1 unnamed protein product [Rotaria magnacalcarata]
MGSKNGKYDFQHGGLSQTRHEDLPSFSSEFNGSIQTKNSRKDMTSIPACIHQDILIDRSALNAENLSLVWLDTDIYRRPSNIDIEFKLKNLLNYVRLFDRVDSCERYIKHIGKMNNSSNIKQEMLFVIISTTLAPTLIPHLHDLTQVKYIYIFGKSKSISKAHEGWLKKYNKVKGIFSSSRILIAQIGQDQN